MSLRATHIEEVSSTDMELLKVGSIIGWQLIEITT
jgi:hypothetical protein